MEAFIHQVFAGLANGSIYASAALALVMIYRSTGMVNFAQGEMAMVSTYIALSLMHAGLPYWGAFFLTIVLSFIGGVAIERFIIRPVSHGSELSVVTVFIGLLLIFNSIAGWIWGYSIQQFPSPFSQMAFLNNSYISPHQLGAVAMTLLVLGLLYVFFRYTKMGLAMRGTADNRASSRLAGIPVGRMLGIGWGLAAAIGAVVGMMVAPTVFLDPNMMIGILLYAFAGALLGGINNPLGAVAGGFIIGVVEDLLGVYVGNELRFTAAMVLIIVVLLFKPAGIWGKQTVRRV
ncbi:branched-chain amino acid ABC transporter permease [Undibacterium sp. TJN25]|uniref:branched-chain amino acid ABC transporter permease n=1 Tax=Undibacterium sp. TJN25 TaxID=3413056 RepID=UPI003BEF5FF6